MAPGFRFRAFVTHTRTRQAWLQALSRHRFRALGFTVEGPQARTIQAKASTLWREGKDGEGLGAPAYSQYLIRLFIEINIRCRLQPQNSPPHLRSQGQQHN